MSFRTPRCPKCTGRLYLDQDIDVRRGAPADWACFQCGWRRVAVPRMILEEVAARMGEEAPEAALALAV